MASLSQSEIEALQGDPSAQVSPPAAPPASGRELRLSIRLDQVPWEAILWFALFALALTLRLWNLDARAVHYDESIHSYDAWKLFRGEGYNHSPWSHGPIQYMMGATGLFLFGDTFAAPRVMPALFGAALVLMPLLLRSRMGKWGALCAGAFIAVSPSLLYFSRFLREDPFVLVWDFGLIVCLWRYLDSKKNRYLYIGALLLALSFSTKETAFIHFAILVSFLAVWWLRAFFTDSEDAARVSGGWFILILALALPLFSAAVGALVDKMPGGLSSIELVNNNNALGAGKVGAPSGGSGAYAAAGIIVFILFIVSLIIGIWWRKWVFLIAMVAFWLLLFTLHTTFFTNMVGIGTGVWQSLGYWIAQQAVERGSQPWYYYFMTLGLYETAVFFVSIAAIAAYTVRRGANVVVASLIIILLATLIAVGIGAFTDSKAVFAPFAVGLLAINLFALGKGDPFEWFLVHWLIISLILFMVAGEKMPWLTTHLALPAAVLAGKAVGDLLGKVPWAEAARKGGLLLFVAVPLLALALYALVKSVPWDESSIGIWRFVGPMIFTALFINLWAYIWYRLGFKTGMKVVSLSLVALMTLFTFRAATAAAFANDDDPKELLVYSQTDDEMLEIVHQIDAFARTSGKGKNLVIYADTSGAALAPWRWYLRGYKNASHRDMSNYTGELTADVVILSSGNQRVLFQAGDRARYDDGRRFNLLQWFAPWTYQRYSFKKFRGDFTSGEDWNNFLRYYMYRDLKSSPAIDSGYAYFRKLGT
ncbi:MAG: TIGR03663 family protein [Chloroflexi bacterium]|nr:TIGR03663 family protein [Chloroflexota bacterium]